MAGRAGSERIGTRLAELPVSVLHAVHRQVEQMQARGHEVLPLHVGEPSFGASKAAVEAMALAMTSGRTTYTSAEGLPELRERLAARLRTVHGIDTTRDRILVTPGSAFALTLVMQAVCSPGDEILLPRIHWPIYAQAAAVARARIGVYPTGPDFELVPELLLAAVTPATRLILLNSPANPTGAVYPADAIAAVVDRARELDIWVIGDEAYEHFVYEGAHTAAARLEAEVEPAARRVFSVHTFSKGYGMTGYRVGYVAAPTTETAALLTRMAEGMIIAPSTPAQYGALAALDDDEMPKRVGASIRQTRDVGLEPALDSGLLTKLPAGGWYAMLDVSDTGLDSSAFAAEVLAAERVAVTPGATFTAPGSPDPGLVRIAFSGDPGMVAEGVGRVAHFVDAHRAAGVVARADR